MSSYSVDRPTLNFLLFGGKNTSQTVKEIFRKTSNLSEISESEFLKRKILYKVAAVAIIATFHFFFFFFFFLFHKINHCGTEIIFRKNEGKK